MDFSNSSEVASDDVTTAGAAPAKTEAKAAPGRPR